MTLSDTADGSCDVTGVVGFARGSAEANHPLLVGQGHDRIPSRRRRPSSLGDLRLPIITSTQVMALRGLRVTYAGSAPADNPVRPVQGPVRAGVA